MEKFSWLIMLRYIIGALALIWFGIWMWIIYEMKKAPLDYEVFKKVRKRRGEFKK